MKKIHLILKTHLDVGYTDYAENVLRRYRDEFIPKAIDLAEKLNADTDKVFVWTTGSYLIKDSLENASEKNKLRLINAIKRGDIRWHALPFTTHTELLDEDTFNWGLGISKQLDGQFGVTTIAAKMTDVPGHTAAIIPLLQKAGVKFLHIGVNNASAVPNVPSAFVWRYNGSEILTVYEGEYGSLYKNEHIDDILYFFHSGDNLGPSNEQEMAEVYKKLKKQFKSYQTVGGTLCGYAEEILKIKHKLPVVEQEIGDTWVHGVASDPFKSAAVKQLIALKNEWLKSGLIKKGDAEHNTLCHYILRAAEHTWGLCGQRYLGDFDNYLNKDFELAKAKDAVEHKLNKTALYDKLYCAQMQIKGLFPKGSYAAMVKSWQHERDYISKAVNGLCGEKRRIALQSLNKLLPSEGFCTRGFDNINLNEEVDVGNFTFVFDALGVKNIGFNGKTILENKTGLSSVNHHSLTADDYAFWVKNFMRNVNKNRCWCLPDYTQPGLEKFKGKYPAGRLNYKTTEILKRGSQILAILTCDDETHSQTSMPKTVQLLYTATQNGLDIEVIWLNKKQSRLPNITYFNLPFNITKGSLKYTKLNSQIDPLNTVEYGARHLAAVENVTFAASGKNVKITNNHAPLVSIGKGKILHFNNIYEPETDGISFALYNNIWQTNFPLWYGNNAYFKFVLDIT
jgi:hypothetical protein